MNKIHGNSELYMIAELLNKEYLDYWKSKPCRMGELLYRYYRNIKKFQICDLFSDLKIRIIRKLFRSKYYQPVQQQKVATNDETRFEELLKTKKVIVYSCITGNYDNVQEPFFEFDNIDFVMFSDNPQIIAPQSIWRAYNISSKLSGFSEPEKNRYIKLHPFEFFEGYDYALYIDGNVRMMSHPLYLLMNSEKVKTGIAMHNHRSRSCIYKEASACKLLKKGNAKKIRAQIKRFKADGFPPNWGLFEANVIAIDLKNPNAKEVMDSWWEELSKSGGGRDQIALPYVLWKLGYQSKDIGFLGNDVTQNPKLRVVNHIK